MKKKSNINIKQIMMTAKACSMCVYVSINHSVNQQGEKEGERSLNIRLAVLPWVLLRKFKKFGRAENNKRCLRYWIVNVEGNMGFFEGGGGILFKPWFGFSTDKFMERKS